MQPILLKRAPMAAIAFALASIQLQAQELSLTTTFAGGNGQDGNMFEITAQRALTLTRFDTHLNFGTIEMEVYYKQGVMQGFEASPAFWTLLGGASVQGQGQGVPTPLPIPLDLNLQAGETYSFYVTNKGGANASAIYTNSAGQVFSNGDLSVTEGYGMVYPFGGTFFPRHWNGIVYYEIQGLSAAPAQLSLASGGTQVLSMGFGAAKAGSVYVLLGSATGTSPGLSLDGNLLPLVYDEYSYFTLVAPNTPPLSNFAVVLDAQGAAQATFSVPAGLPASFAGLTLYHANLLLDVSGVPTYVSETSSATSVLLIP